MIDKKNCRIMWNISAVWVTLLQMMQDVYGKFDPGENWQSSIQQEAKSFHQQIGLTFKEETSRVLWRIKTNEELDKLIKHKNIVNYIKAQRLSWFGHVQRMSDTRII
jgi:hypothetical protein